MQLSKVLLSQYRFILCEIEDLKRKKAEVEKQIEKLLEDGVVKDKVYGGMGGIQGFAIEGFPLKEYNRRRMLLRKRNDALKRQENDLLELLSLIEHEINAIGNSRDRQILKMFFIDGVSQSKIAEKFYIDQSVVSRIIKKYTEN